MQLVQSQGKMEIQKEQNELKQFLLREKKKDKTMKKLDERFKDIETKQTEMMREHKKEVLDRMMKTKARSEKRIEKEERLERSLERSRKD